MLDEKDPSPVQEEFASLMNRLELARTRWQEIMCPGMIDAATSHLTEAQRLLDVMTADPSKIPTMIEGFRSRINLLEETLSRPDELKKERFKKWNTPTNINSPKSNPSLRFQDENPSIEKWLAMSCEERGKLLTQVQERNDRWIGIMLGELDALWIVVIDGEVRDYSDEICEQPSNYALADYGRVYGKAAFGFVSPIVFTSDSD